ncbi:hypothetical protein GCM10010965_08340 [Caldalkalibacillus thermarum]|uniref:YheC/YheD family endospore coat-associated protein n=1 Tax=Caldalkalibacillus thermarum TaxID=296745 RepID=UPI00166A1C1F|nr:YheC/YheD family protein [Caldalkalibacillus thermarum]GGK17669.1 hypothetical protein GCM10010965_08340 [Caldalkalibacillus thermarum]
MAKLIIGHIQKHTSSRNTVFLCPELFSLIQDTREISLSYGQQKVKARIKRSPHRSFVFVSANLWNRLKIPFPGKLHFHLQANQLSIGPLVGILTTGVTHYDDSPIGGRTNFMRRFLTASQDVPASYFVFSPQDISYLHKEINGYFLIKTKKGKLGFRRYRVPFPHVVYNRVPNRVQERSAAVSWAKTALEKEGVHIFNPAFFNKWTIHEKIHHLEEVQHYIPETIFNPDISQIARMLDIYHMVYLKPASGSLGLGIAQLYHSPGKGYFLRYRRGNENKLFRFHTLTKAINHFMRHKSSKTYIVQQGIPLMTLAGRQIDFRVHTNKNRQGEWEVTAIAAKLAGRGSVTTHMRTGGKVLSPREAIQKCFPLSQQHQVLTELKEAALTLSRAIDQEVDGNIGELGFDIGIDQNGHPWMFEANSKPGRHVFTHASLKESEVLTRRKILEYALYLAQFTAEDVKTGP